MSVVNRELEFDGPCTEEEALHWCVAVLLRVVSSITVGTSVRRAVHRGGGTALVRGSTAPSTAASTAPGTAAAGTAAAGTAAAGTAAASTEQHYCWH